MEYFLLIILLIIVSVIFAATKKKPKYSKWREYAPPPTLSDIQRAFWMATHAPEKQQPYQPAPQAAPFTPPESSVIHAGVPQEGKASRQPVAPTVSESYTGISEDNLVKPMAVVSVRPLADIPDFPGRNNQAAPASSAPGTAHIPLFQDRQDVVRAFIFSEILPRRTYPRRFR